MWKSFLLLFLHLKSEYITLRFKFIQEFCSPFNTISSFDVGIFPFWHWFDIRQSPRLTSDSSSSHYLSPSHFKLPCKYKRIYMEGLKAMRFKTNIPQMYHPFTTTIKLMPLLISNMIHLLYIFFVSWLSDISEYLVIYLKIFFLNYTYEQFFLKINT